MTNPAPTSTTMPQRFWVRLWIWLWRGLMFFWVTIVIGLAVNVVSTRLTSETNFSATTPMGWILHNLMLTISIGSSLILLTLLVGVLSHRDTTHASRTTSVAPTSQNRTTVVRALQQEYNR